MTPPSPFSPPAQLAQREIEARYASIETPSCSDRRVLRCPFVSLSLSLSRSVSLVSLPVPSAPRAVINVYAYPLFHRTWQPRRRKPPSLPGRRIGRRPLQIRGDGTAATLDPLSPVPRAFQTAEGAETERRARVPSRGIRRPTWGSAADDRRAFVSSLVTRQCTVYFGGEVFY